MAEKSASQRIKELDAERASILEHAKGEALQKANYAIEELNSLGFNYRLVNGHEKAKATKGGTSKRSIKDAPCPICGFQTAPPHDGRTHRSQKKKAAFTASELRERELVKV
jgi:hypothetical protein